MQNLSRVSNAGAHGPERHPLKEPLKSEAHSLECMKRVAGEERGVEYIGSRSVRVIFDYYKDDQGELWYQSIREEEHV